MKEINVLLLEEGQELRPERVDPSPEGLTAILGQGPKQWIPLFGWRGGRMEYTSAIMVCRNEDYEAMYRTHARVPCRCLLCGVDNELTDLYPIDRRRLLASCRKYGAEMFLDDIASGMDSGGPDGSPPLLRLFQEDDV